jgi:hypothetical protein
VKRTIIAASGQALVVALFRSKLDRAIPVEFENAPAGW